MRVLGTPLGSYEISLTRNRPHICPVFDVGSQAGIDFLVLKIWKVRTIGS